MKYILKQLAVLVVVACVALIAATVSARQVTTPPTPNIPNFDGNTPRPINTGVDPDIKEGGLLVNAFTAFQNASFLKRVDLEGILTGGEDSSTDSVLSFGDPSKVTSSAGTVITRIVDLVVNGGVYIQGQDSGLYSKEKGTNAQLCANPDGVIVLCTVPVKYGTVKIIRRDSNTDDSILVLTGFPSTFSSNASSISYQVQTGTYTFSARCDADPSLAANPQRDPTYPQLTSLTPTSGSTVTVQDGQTTTITGVCTCVYDTSSVKKCL